MGFGKSGAKKISRDFFWQIEKCPGTL